MLLVDVWHPPIWLSLAVIAGVLAATALLSLRMPPRRSPSPRGDFAAAVGETRPVASEQDREAG